MQIKHLIKVDAPGKTRAFFSVEWEGRLMIHDCRLVEGKNGLFIQFPFRTYQANGQTKYQPIVVVEQDLLVKISELALHEYRETK
jgi:DNA-binding cell septation regulator SpoVG